MPRVLMLGLLLVGLAGCLADAGRTPYRAERNGYGYSERWFSEDSVEVRFTHAPGVTKETAEACALYRAAELAVEHGSERFAVLDRHSESDVMVERRHLPAYRAAGSIRTSAAKRQPQVARDVKRQREIYHTVLVVRLLAPDEVAEGRTESASEVIARLAPLVRGEGG